MNLIAEHHLVVVIGGGPVGLAAAAHLAERDLDFVVLESGPSVASANEEGRHVRLFRLWRYATVLSGSRLKDLVQSGRVQLISSFRIESADRTHNGRVVLGGTPAGDRDTVVNSTRWRATGRQHAMSSWACRARGGPFIQASRR